LKNTRNQGKGDHKMDTSGLRSTLTQLQNLHASLVPQASHQALDASSTLSNSALVGCNSGSSALSAEWDALDSAKEELRHMRAEMCRLQKVGLTLSTRAYHDSRQERDMLVKQLHGIDLHGGVLTGTKPQSITKSGADDSLMQKRFEAIEDTIKSLQNLES